MPSVADTIRVSGRDFVTTHPWISFQLDLARVDRRCWQMLGEARSKCRHLIFTPLKPSVARELETIYLAKGVQATTAIEGNTLTLAQVQDAVEGRLKVPPSQEYLKQEVENVLQACRLIEARIADSGDFEITPQLVKELNALVLNGLKLEDHVVPGEYRDKSVVVGTYRGAPSVDVDYLVEMMGTWLNGETFDPPDHADAFLYAFLKAVATHLYIAWIHPFGDGNGRTARLLEFGILTAAGIPSVAAQLLSNHYKLTRSAYYRHLDLASRSGGDIGPFMSYAAHGLVDLLQEELNRVHDEMFDIAWENLVHETFQPRAGEAAKRQRNLVIALGRRDQPVKREDLTQLTRRLTQAYAGRGPKTVTRDLTKVIETGLVRRLPDGAIEAAREIMFTFTPRIGGHMRNNVVVDFSDVSTTLESSEEAPGNGGS